MRVYIYTHTYTYNITLLSQMGNIICLCTLDKLLWLYYNRIPRKMKTSMTNL